MIIFVFNCPHTAHNSEMSDGHVSFWYNKGHMDNGHMSPICHVPIVVNLFIYTCAAGSGMLFQDQTDIKLTMSEDEAAKVNEMLDDAARSAADRMDLRGGFYTDPTAADGSWHHMSDADIDGMQQWSLFVIFFFASSALCLDMCHFCYSVWCEHFGIISFIWLFVFVEFCIVISAPCRLWELWLFVGIDPIRFLAGCHKGWLNQRKPKSKFILGRIFKSVCLFVCCLFVRSITQKWIIPKCSNLV